MNVRNIYREKETTLNCGKSNVMSMDVSATYKSNWNDQSQRVEKKFEKQTNINDEITIRKYIYIYICFGFEFRIVLHFLCVCVSLHCDVGHNGTDFLFEWIYLSIWAEWCFDIPYMCVIDGNGVTTWSTNLLSCNVNVKRNELDRPLFRIVLLLHCARTTRKLFQRKKWGKKTKKERIEHESFGK